MHVNLKSYLNDRLNYIFKFDNCNLHNASVRTTYIYYTIKCRGNRIFYSFIQLHFFLDIFNDF